MDSDPDPGGPKTCGSGFGSGSATACHLQAFLLKEKKKSYTYFDSPARGKSNKPKSFEGYKFPKGTTTKRGDILPD
jgi:hypothetical protein